MDYNSVAQQTTVQLHAFHDFYRTQQYLNVTGRRSKGATGLLYVLALELSRLGGYDYLVERSSLARRLEVHPNTIDDWLERMSGFNLITKRQSQNCISINITETGHKFIHWLRGGKPLVDNYVHENVDENPTVIPTVIPDDPIPYTDQKSEKTKDIINNNRPRAFTTPTEEESRRITNKIKQPNTTQGDKKAFINACRRLSFSPDDVIFAHQTYEACKDVFEIEKPLGFIIEQAKKEKIKRLEPIIDNISAKTAGEILQKTNSNEPSIEQCEDTFQLIKEALECNLFN